MTLSKIPWLAVLILVSGLAGNPPPWQRRQPPRATEETFSLAVEHYNAGRYAIAESILRKLVSQGGGDFESAARLLLMKANYQLERYPLAQEIGRDFLVAFPESRYRPDVWLCYGDIFLAQGAYGSAFRLYLKAREYSNEPTFLNRLDRRLVRIIALNIPAAVVDELLALQTSPARRSILTLAKAYGQHYAGMSTDCAQTLASLNPEEVPPAFYDLFEKLVLATYGPGKPTLTVGVVLPLSGAGSSAGRAFLRGLQEIYTDRSGEDPKVALIVRDNNSRGVETVRSIRVLEQNHQVVAIIGPLAETNALLAATALGDSDLPLLLPSAIHDQLSGVSTPVFQLRTSLQLQGKLAARYAGETLGLDSLAVIAPSDDFGHSLADAFIKEVDALGKVVVASEWYSGIPEDLGRQFKSLRSRAFELQPGEDSEEELLGMEIDSLDALFDIVEEDFFDFPEEEVKVLTKADSARIDLETIQGLYLPIHREHLAFVGPQFPMYNLKTRLIGNEPWQDLEILNQDNIGPHVTGLSILTNWIRVEDVPEDMDHGDRAALEYLPQGRDCARLLSHLYLTGPATRQSVALRLSELDEFRTPSQVISFSDPYPYVNTALQALEYRQGRFLPRGFFMGDRFQALPIDRP